MSTTTAADVLLERLIDWGVDTIFGLPGDGINGIMESLRTHQDKVRFIHVRHEEAAAFVACGYAKFTGRWVSAWRRPGPAASISSTVCTTPSSTVSRCWRSPVWRFMT